MSHAVITRAWEGEGERLGERLGAVSSAVVVAADSEAAARLALGIARVQGRRRRVAIGDLAGGEGVLHALARSDDIHGLVDSFLYGVSLNHIARPLAGQGNVFILPCGTEPPSPEVLAHPRWRRLTAGFREVDALLLLVAPAEVEGLAQLVEATEGTIVADLDPSAVPGPVIAHIPPRTEGEPAAFAASDLGEERSRDLVEPGVADVQSERTKPEAELGWPYVERRRAPRPSALRRAAPAIGAAVALLAAGAGGIWYGRETSRRESQEAAARAVAAAQRHQDSASAVVAAPPPIPVENPGDSSAAAAYAIQLVVANTQDGATASLTRDQRSALPAATISPVIYAGDTARWYRVVVGAESRPAAADSLLLRLRRERNLGVDAGKVVRVPLALMLARDVPPDSARASVRALRLIGIPAYALTQANGTARVYAGAFEATDLTPVLAEQLRSAGLQPSVVYRTGRPL